MHVEALTPAEPPTKGADGTWYQSTRGLLLHSETLRPQGPARALVVAFHGAREYSATFQPLAAALVEQCGAVVCLLDNHGHGRSQLVGQRGLVSSADALVDDAVGFLLASADAHPQLPLFVVGNSMGGAVAVLAATQAGRSVAGLVLSVPLVARAPEFCGLLRLSIAACAAVAPLLPLTPDYTGEMFSDDEIGRRFAADPLVAPGPGPARTVQALVRLGDLVHAAAPAVDMPLLVLQAGIDSLTPPEGAREFLGRVATPEDRKRLHLFGDARHELWHEPVAGEAVAVVSAWMQTIVGGD